MFNTLKSLWYGKIPLRRAFWVYGVLVLMVNTLIIFLIGVFAAALQTDSSVPLILIFYVGSFYQSIAYTGIYRSAIAYDGRKVWRVLAIVYAIVCMILLAHSLFTFNDRLADWRSHNRYLWMRELGSF